MAKDKIFILTGAGISKESGLDTFRDTDGIWAKYKVENVATPEGFSRNPALVHEFYNGRRNQLRSVSPNAAHHAIARLQEAWGDQVFLVTQNIDDLHERALESLGVSARVWHMHGELLQSLCALCGKKDFCDFDLSVDLSCSDCGEKGCIRPNIVWFGEMPYHMDAIENAISEAAVFVSIGTSGHVYPAAGFVAEAMRQGCRRRIELNLEDSEVSFVFTEHHRGKATEVVPRVLAELRNSGNQLG